MKTERGPRKRFGGVLLRQMLCLHKESMPLDALVIPAPGRARLVRDETVSAHACVASYGADLNSKYSRRIRHKGQVLASEGAGVPGLNSLPFWREDGKGQIDLELIYRDSYVLA